MTAPQPSISFELSPRCNRAPPPSESLLAHTYAIPPTHSLCLSLPAPPLGPPALVTVRSYKNKNPPTEGCFVSAENQETQIPPVSGAQGCTKDQMFIATPSTHHPIFPFWAARLTFLPKCSVSSRSFGSQNASGNFLGWNSHGTADGNLITCVIHKEDSRAD